jgi:hypothetical protein
MIWIYYTAVSLACFIGANGEQGYSKFTHHYVTFYAKCISGKFGIGKQDYLGFELSKQM